MHTDHRQSLRRGGRACVGAVARGEDFIHLRRFPSPAAYLDQRADDVPHHVVEEPVALHGDVNLVAVLGNLEGIQVSREDLVC